MKKSIAKIKEYVNIIEKVIRLLWRSSCKYTLLIVGINFLLGIIPPINSIIWMRLLNITVESIKSGNLKNVLPYLYCYVFMTCLLNCLKYVDKYCDSILSSYVNKYIIDITIKKVEQMSMSRFDDSEFYNRIKMVNNESASRSMSILRTITNMIAGGSTLIIVTVILARFSPILIVVSIAVCIPSMLVAMKIALKQYGIYIKRFEKIRWIDYLKNMMVEYEYIKEIKINNVYNYIRSKATNSYEEYIAEDKNIRGKYCQKRVLINIIEEHINFIIRSIVLIKVIYDKRTIGEFSLYVSSIDNFRNSIATILNTIASVFEDGLYIQNLFNLLNEEGNINKGDQEFSESFEKVTFENVWFKYPNTQKYVLEGVNLELKSKESYSFVGLNGSGKTTILKLILKLYKPDKGKIYIDGVNIEKINTDDYYSHIGVLFQDFIKYPMTVKENIGVGDIASLYNDERILQAAMMSGANQFIEKLTNGYDTKLLREWSESEQLSLGQWQKIAISRAFMKKAAILILDEPTSSLDPEAEYDIYKKFKEMMSGKMCIFISHRYSTVQLVDKIYVLKDGKIVEEGKHSELIKLKGEYERLYTNQAETYWKNK